MIWSLVQAPAGMKINADLGLIEWTPNDDQVGSHNIIVAATEMLRMQKPDRHNS